MKTSYLNLNNKITSNKKGLKMSLQTVMESLLTCSYYKGYFSTLKLSKQSGIYARSERRTADPGMKTGFCELDVILLFLIVSIIRLDDFKHKHVMLYISVSPVITEIKGELKKGVFIKD